MEQVFYLSKDHETRKVMAKPYSFEYNTACKQYAYCTGCGMKQELVIEDGLKYSSYTGNLIMVAYLVCPNYKENHKLHVKHYLMDLFRCRSDGFLYTSDFFTVEDGISKINERSNYVR